MVYIPLTSVNGVSSSYLLSGVLSALAVKNLFMQKKIVYFSKLPFMLISIRERDASWFTATETAISNLETEHGIII